MFLFLQKICDFEFHFYLQIIQNCIFFEIFGLVYCVHYVFVTDLSNMIALYFLCDSCMVVSGNLKLCFCFYSCLCKFLQVLENKFDFPHLGSNIIDVLT